MSQSSVLEASRSIGHCEAMLEGMILAHVEEQTVIGLDSLVLLMPDYSWSQVFHAIDRLTRGRRIVLRRHRSEYTIFSNQYAA